MFCYYENIAYEAFGAMRNLPTKSVDQSLRRYLVAMVELTYTKHSAKTDLNECIHTVHLSVCVIV